MAEAENVSGNAERVSAADEPVTRTKTGTVISNRMDKTITVLVERRVQHPVYGKIIRRSSKIHAHDEENACGMGDTVTISECRPYSKMKSWVLDRIDEKAREV